MVWVSKWSVVLFANTRDRREYRVVRREMINFNIYWFESPGSTMIELSRKYLEM